MNKKFPSSLVEISTSSTKFYFVRVYLKSFTFGEIFVFPKNASNGFSPLKCMFNMLKLLIYQNYQITWPNF
ncbi:hypothetical protein TNIN_488101 [Trichonephila inaurata madagascariensis]|uniref:Uncharacterized protein n=1 Tax=Trichonephila inaurata madagascariensis TaxID=2747483 RepID=A0A8X7CF47_9ARAC|nr:hypothetical protein TNIN_488101 [Trichonephila inaurata madagascariensis]